MSQEISKTLIKVISEQAFRLGLELKKKYGEDQSQFLSKHSVASVYGFEHWCNMIHFIRTNEEPLSYSDFRDVDLHPKNISFESPDFINFWDIKKERLGKVLNIKPSIYLDSPAESYTGDELSNYLAKMYGFTSMSELWSNLKYHIQYRGKYYSLFDTKDKELLINIGFKPKNSEFLQDLIINHLNFGKTLVVGPKEWFKYEFDYSNIRMAEDYVNKDAFYGWTIQRLINLFLSDIKHRFGNYVTHETAKNILEVIIPIMVFDYLKAGYPINMIAFCEILKLKNLLLIIGDPYYPKALQFLVKDYLKSLGHEFKDTFSTLNEKVQKKHDNGAMLISHSVFNLSSLFEHNGFSVSDDLRIIDAENIGYFSKFEQKNRGINISDEIISELALLDKKAMVIIFDSVENPVDENYITPIREYCKLKNMIFTIVSEGDTNRFSIKNKIKISEKAEIMDFILEP